MRGQQESKFRIDLGQWAFRTESALPDATGQLICTMNSSQKSLCNNVQRNSKTLLEISNIRIGLTIPWSTKCENKTLPKFSTEYDRANVPPYNGNDPPPAPGSLKRSLFPTLLNEVQNKGTQGVRARYGAELPPIISIVRYPGRPVISVTEKLRTNNIANKRAFLIVVNVYFLKTLEKSQGGVLSGSESKHNDITYGGGHWIRIWHVSKLNWVRVSACSHGKRMKALITCMEHSVPLGKRGSSRSFFVVKCRESDSLSLIVWRVYDAHRPEHAPKCRKALQSVAKCRKKKLMPLHDRNPLPTSPFCDSLTDACARAYLGSPSLGGTPCQVFRRWVRNSESRPCEYKQTTSCTLMWALTSALEWESL